MLKDFKFHHIGFVTYKIEETAVIYLSAGYLASDIFIDSIQNVKICFITKDCHPKIELIEPLNEFSSINKILKKSGVTPYHICYEVEDIHIACEILCKMGYIALFRPIEAIALNDRLICYLYKKEIGYIELLNR